MNSDDWIRPLVHDCVEDMQQNDEHVPQPQSSEQFSGEFMVRVLPDTHRLLIIDKQDKYYLNKLHVMKNNKAMYIGPVIINKNYVSFNLIPVYVFSELLKSISLELMKRLQRKSCFNFKVTDAKLFDELR